MPRITPGVTELRMQLATVGPVLPSAVLNTYGAAVLLTSPRANGGIVPLAIRAVCTLALGNITLRIRPTWSDGTTGAGVVNNNFSAGAGQVDMGLLLIPLNGTPVVPGATFNAPSLCGDSTFDLSACWKHGVTLTQLTFDCQSDQNNDTATFTITYFGLYT